MEHKFFTRLALLIAAASLSVSLFTGCDKMKTPTAPGRPIWVFAHGANKKMATARALELGANGVEIDVRSRDGVHWNLDHDHYYSEEECDRTDVPVEDVHVSLRWFLTQPVARYDGNEFSVKLNDDPRLCALWIDCKNEEHVESLVAYVHSCLPRGVEKYNFSIIYNLYTVPTVAERIDPFDPFSQYEVHVPDEYLQTMDRVFRSLEDNEYLNWGNCTMEEINFLFAELRKKNLTCSPSNHFFTRGIFDIDQPQNTTASKRDDLRNVQLLEPGTFCKRYGVWSNVTANNAEAWINFGMQAVLTYFDQGVRPTVECRPNALPDLVWRIRNEEGSLYGKVHIATRDEETF